MDIVLIFVSGLATGLAVCWLRINTAFPAQQAEDYNSARQNIDLKRHLSGDLICEGIIFGPFGRVSSRFVAKFKGEWDDAEGRLRETFTYDSGETLKREWRIRLGQKGLIEAQADDVLGTASGHQAGSAVGMSYRLRLPEASGGWVLDATDWMYLLDNGTIVNRSQFRKFGITVAELVATIRPKPAERRESVGVQKPKRIEKQRTAA